MMERNKRSIRLGDELSTFIAKRTKKEFTDTLKLHAAWEVTATPQTLAHTDNVVFSTRSKQPVVLVYVDDARWAAELTANKEINRFVLERALMQPVYDIKFLVSRCDTFKKVFKKGAERRERRASAPETLELTTQEEQEVREMVSSVKDPDLKEKLYNTIKKDIEWKKGT